MKTVNFSFVRSLCSLLIGLVLLLWPDAATKYIVITIGALFLLPGILSLGGYFLFKPKEGASHRFPLEGLGSLLLGAWLVAMPDFFANALIILLGVLLILGGIQQLVLLTISRRWSRVPLGFYLLPALITIAGFFAVFKPVDTGNTILMLIGVTTIAYALSELVHWFCFFRKRPSPINRNQLTDVVDAEIID